MSEKAPQIDWQQVILNGGPLCFFVEDGKYCGRAERWPGHGTRTFHDFVSLNDLLATVRREEREAAFKKALGEIAVLPSQGAMNYRRGYEEGLRDALRTLESLAALERAATTDKEKR